MSVLSFPPDEIRTDRLLIRRYRLGDGPELARSVAASHDHLAPWMPWAWVHKPEREAELLVREFVGKWLLLQDFILCIRTPDDREQIGSSGFHLRHGPAEDGVAEIGMWIAGDRAGQGLGTHALETLTAWGFSEWPWLRLVWKCDSRNAASRRVAEKAGYTLEGLTRSDAVAVDGSRRDTSWYARLKP